MIRTTTIANTSDAAYDIARDYDFRFTTADLVSFAAARAGVTQRSPSPRKTLKYGDGERCVTPTRAAAKETTADQILHQDPVHVCK